MRVKINGPVTPEKLAKALSEAQEQLDNLIPGCEFFGANLYLNSYNPDGERIDIFNSAGKPIIITIKANPGETVRPKMTAEALERREKAKAEEARRQAEYEAAQRAEELEWRRSLQASRQRLREAESAYEALCERTEALLTSAPDTLVEKLNAIVEEVWHTTKPVRPHGKHKGEPVPMPRYSHSNGELLISSPTWKHPRITRSPVGTGFDDSGMRLYWVHPAWQEATKRIQVLIAELAAELTYV